LLWSSYATRWMKLGRNAVRSAPRYHLGATFLRMEGKVVRFSAFDSHIKSIIGALVVGIVGGVGVTFINTYTFRYAHVLSPMFMQW